MDVRCEKCNTEYELDEDKLKPGGVTVKCTSCGHMFKIRRRQPTQVGMTADRPRRPSRPTPPPPPPAARQRRASSQGGATRQWLVRTASGEVETCRELATLQQWIVSGKVTRASEISRTGKTWKPLGDIPELSRFFEVAEEARRGQTSSSPPPRALGSTPPPHPTGARPGSVPAAAQQTGGSGPVPAGRAPTGGSEPVPAGRAPTDGSGPVPAARPAEHSEPVALDRPTGAGAGTGAAPQAPADQRSTGAWAAQQAGRRVASGDDGPSGPTGGLARGIPTDDVAFAGARIKPLEDDFGNATDDEDDDLIRPPTSGLGRWIALVSVLVIGAALGVVYLLVFRTDGEGASAAIEADAGADEVAEVVEDAGAAIDADLLEDAAAALDTDARSELERAASALAEASTGSDDPQLLLARGRIEAALAQHLADQAAAADDTDQARALARAAQERILEASKMARKASRASPDQAGAQVLMADVLRLQGKSRREIERYLRKAPEDEPQARLVRAMTLARDNQPRQARRILRELAAAGDAEGDVRPRYRLAVLELAEERLEQARAAAEAVLERSPEHAGAERVLERIEAPTEVAAGDPMPEEVDDDGDDDGRGGGGRPTIDTYDGLLDRADKLAENGNCDAAMDDYERALDENPIGVAALTGMGYCHLDKREYASAHRKFKAALGISPRYQVALYGIAEAYQQQGLSSQAIEAYQRYLSIHPSGTRADMARRQIERLGGSTGDESGNDESDGDDTDATGTTAGDTDTGGGDTSGGSSGAEDTGEGADTTGGGATDSGEGADTADTGGAADTGTGGAVDGNQPEE